MKLVGYLNSDIISGTGNKYVIYVDQEPTIPNRVQSFLYSKGEFLRQKRALDASIKICLVHR